MRPQLPQWGGCCAASQGRGSRPIDVLVNTLMDKRFGIVLKAATAAMIHASKRTDMKIQVAVPKRDRAVEP